MMDDGRRSIVHHHTIRRDKQHEQQQQQWQSTSLHGGIQEGSRATGQEQRGDEESPLVVTNRQIVLPKLHPLEDDWA
jgi:hypothetical protein